MTDLSLRMTSTNPATGLRIGLGAALFLTNHKSRITSHDLRVTTHAFLIDTKTIRNHPISFTSSNLHFSNRHGSAPYLASLFSPLAPRPAALAPALSFGAISMKRRFRHEP